MRRLRRSLFVASLAAACIWGFVVARTALQLRTLFEGADDAPSVAQIARAPVPIAERLEPEQSATRASSNGRPSADLGGERLQPATGELTAAQIMRLLEDEIATETDSAAADELLRTFGQSLDSQE